MKHFSDCDLRDLICADVLTIEKVCEMFYSVPGGGPSKVLDFVNFMEINGADIDHLWCVPCEDKQPHHNGECLVCGTTNEGDEVPAHKEEGSQAEFDRYIAGDRAR